MDIIISSNNRKINASLQEVQGSVKVLIVAPGIGVSRYFYSKFAEYFANLGYSVLTFDYYGMHPNEEPNDEIHLKDWGEQDIRAVIAFCKERYPVHKLFFVGHSIAGQLFPLAANSNQISSSCFVASQNVSFQHWQGIARLKVYLFWSLVIPLFISLRGKLPNFAYGGKYDLNPTIAADWASWGKSRLGVVEKVDNARKAYNNLKVPAKFFSIEKDHLLAPESSVKVLYDQYGSSAKMLEHINPKKYGLTSMGHFDFFRSEFSFLWPRIEEWFLKTEG